MKHLNWSKVVGDKFSKRSAASAAVLAPEYIRRSLLGAQSTFAANEAYKAARTNLLFTRTGDGCQVIAFTSTFQGEGKTVNCCNLALSVAQNGQKVLIIDADMRRPMIANMFGIPNKTGLSQYLAGIVEADAKSGDKQLPIVQTEYPNLSVLTSGSVPPNSAELLSSERMKMLLDIVTEKFDYIFIDTPPISVVTDAAVLAQRVQGYVLVVRAGITHMENLRSVVAKMEQLNANVLGFILNDLDAKSGSYKYTGYRSYHKYGYKRGYYRENSQSYDNGMSAYEAAAVEAAAKDKKQ
ncbi:MAG: CpsD/CapB family tyrosine-protein kinase [Clostridia bacterium]